MVLNAAARLVVGLGKYKHNTPVLHWLLMPQRIQIKTAALAFDCIRGTGAAYFSHVVHIWPFWSLLGCARWSVRSMNQNNQAWPTELFYRCSSRLELTSTTSPLSVHKLPTVSSWAPDSSLQGSVHWQPLRRTIVEEWFELKWTDVLLFLMHHALGRTVKFSYNCLIHLTRVDFQNDSWENNWAASLDSSLPALLEPNITLNNSNRNCPTKYERQTMRNI